MPHYYFHLRHGSQLTIDAEGQDFPTMTPREPKQRKQSMKSLPRQSAVNAPTCRR